MQPQSRYNFEDPHLAERSNAELHALIAHNVDQACAKDVGPLVALHRRDYARDIIAQARDILVNRGELFSPYDRVRMSFLPWPVSSETAYPGRHANNIQWSQDLVPQPDATHIRRQMRKRYLTTVQEKRALRRTQLASGARTALIIIAGVLLLYLA